MRIVIAAEPPMFRAGLRLLLTAHEGFDVVGEAGTHAQLIEVLRRTPAEIVLVELAPGGSLAHDVAQVADLRGRFPGPSLAVLSAREDGAYVRGMLAAGALGFISKHATPGELEFALRALGQGDTFISPRLSRGLIDRRTASRATRAPRLSERQRQVLRHIGDGRSTQETAALMSVSVKTIETHRARLQEKLRVRGTHGLMVAALQVYGRTGS